MNKVDRVIFGLYSAVLFIVLLLLSFYINISTLGPFRLIVGFFVIAVAVAIFILPLYLLFNEETNLSHNVRVSLAVLYVTVLFFGGIFLIIKYRNQPFPMPKDDFTVALSDTQMLISNNSDTDYYNCRFSVKNKGSLIEYQAFFSNYSFVDCRNKNIQESWECFLNNQVKRILYSQRSRTLPKFDSKSDLPLKMEQFFKDQSVRADSFLLNNTVADIYNLAVTCRNPRGRLLQDEISSDKFHINNK